MRNLGSLESGEEIVEALFQRNTLERLPIFWQQKQPFCYWWCRWKLLLHSNSIPSDSIQLMFPLDASAKIQAGWFSHGGSHCESIFSKDCHANAYISKDSGKTFSTFY